MGSKSLRKHRNKAIGMCLSKAAYESFDTAKNHSESKDQRVYLCPFCGNFHKTMMVNP